VLDFLGAEPAPPGWRPDLGRRVNAAPAADIPETLAAALAERYLEPLRALADEFGDPPARWLARAEALAGGHR
jgi:hypothetical protein